MLRKVLSILFGVHVIVVIVLVLKVEAKLRVLYEQYDPLLVARCEAKCWRMEKKWLCVRGCLHESASKPGRCPSSPSSPFATACLEACHVDSECPAVAKCCKHSCGVTCQPPDGLQTVTDIPEVPKDIKVLEAKRKRTVHIEWVAAQKVFQLPKNRESTIVYLIEERHHAGKYFLENRLTEWSPIARTTKKSQKLKRIVKPARWYQFRVAAVNENGTKGYSDVSQPFKLSISPKPPGAPQNMSVGPLMRNPNGSVSAQLRWSPPLSDLPVQRYRVFWSRRLHGERALDSVLVHQQLVPRDQTFFLLQNLQPNSLYFLQVQALVQFGKDRLKGEKSGLILNTTNYVNATDNALTLDQAILYKIEDLHLQKLFFAHDDLRARIAWRAKLADVRYAVTWWTGPCRQNYNHYKSTAITLDTYFDLHDLQFNCRYRVSVREITSNATAKPAPDTSVTFTTPECSKLKASVHKRLRCN